MMMDWERVDATLRSVFRKRGSGGKFHDVVEPAKARTPLTELISREPAAELEEMGLAELREFAHAHNVALPQHGPIEDLVEAVRAELEARWEERTEGMLRTLEYVFADGPHPLAVNRRVYAMAKALKPELIMDMSLADLAALCGDGNGPRGTDGRATVSARVKRIYEAPIKKAGMRGCKASYQKDADASASYSESAKGNQNRRGRDFLEVNGGGKQK